MVRKVHKNKKGGQKSTYKLKKVVRKVLKSKKVVRKVPTD